MSQVIINLTELHSDMIVSWFTPGDMVTQSFVTRGDGENNITYYFIPCKRNEVKSFTLSTPDGEKREKSIDQFEEDLREVHNKFVSFVYK